MLREIPTARFQVVSNGGPPECRYGVTFSELIDVLVCAFLPFPPFSPFLCFCAFESLLLLNYLFPLNYEHFVRRIFIFLLKLTLI